jgi:hypothetical protein
MFKFSVSQAGTVWLQRSGSFADAYPNGTSWVGGSCVLRVLFLQDMNRTMAPLMKKFQGEFDMLNRRVKICSHCWHFE